jgi:hypothetical protein
VDLCPFLPFDSLKISNSLQLFAYHKIMCPLFVVILLKRTLHGVSSYAFFLNSTLMIHILVLQVFLDPKERANTEYKLDTFSSIYRRLCGKEVVFDYPVAESA